MEDTFTFLNLYTQYILQYMGLGLGLGLSDYIAKEENVLALYLGLEGFLLYISTLFLFLLQINIQNTVQDLYIYKQSNK